MKTFAIIAVRLTGLWVLAGSLGGLVVLGWQLLGTEPFSDPDDPVVFVSVLAMLTPLLAGLLLMLFSRLIAALITAGVAAEAPPPEPVTVRAFTQIGVFLLGVFTLLRSLPLLIGSFVGGIDLTLDHWITGGLGLVLVFFCVSFGKLVEQLRR